MLSVDAAANEVRIALVPPEVALLADALGREPATLPPDAIEPVLARLERVQAVAPFELPPALVGDTVAGDTRIVCQLEPLGDAGFALELAVGRCPRAACTCPATERPSST